ncbi:MAG: hypothetical protein Q6363_008160 [Candidatus Njordarchaeota archaeon]
MKKIEMINSLKRRLEDIGKGYKFERRSLLLDLLDEVEELLTEESEDWVKEELEFIKECIESKLAEI